MSHPSLNNSLNHSESAHGANGLDIHAAMNTDAGRSNAQNQDAIGHLVPTEPDVLATLGQIFVLADGVEGLEGGDLASHYAVSTIISSYYDQEEGEPAERLVVAFAEANNMIYGEWFAQEPPRIMATRVVAAVVRGHELIIGNVGESPAFLMRNAEPRQLTRDPFATAEAAQADEFPVDDPAIVRQLTRALGSRKSVKVDITQGKLRDGDRIVLCSAGVAQSVTPLEIERTVATHAPQQAVEILIDMAHTRDGENSVSVIVMRASDVRDMTQPANAIPQVEDWGSGSLEDDIRALRSSRLSANGEPDSDQSAARRRRRQRQNFRETVEGSPLPELWAQMRGNMMLTAVGMGLLLVIFLVVLILIFNSGSDDEGEGASAPQPTVVAQDSTATAAGFQAATALAGGSLTEEALIATEDAQRATAAVLTQTPPAPSGPQMVKDDWFRVQPGEPVPAFAEPDVNAEPASPLEPGANYLIQTVDDESWNGPWYEVVDNLGIELRWVNGPSLHQRVLRVSTSGEPLPDDLQPEDIPPSVVTPTRAVRATATVPLDQEGTTAPVGTGSPEAPADGGETPVSADETPAAAPTPTLVVSYTADTWDPGTQVYAQADFTLRSIPSLDGNETEQVGLNEAAEIVQGPMAADGHWWWRIRLDDGRVGWVAQPLLSFNAVP